MDYDKIKYHRFTENRKEEFTRRLSSLLASEGNIILAFLFGSFARRNRTRDIDLGIQAVPPLTFSELMRLGVKIESEVGIPIDIVQIQDLNPAFRLRVLKQGIPVILDEETREKLISVSLQELMDFRMSLTLAKNGGKSAS